MEFYRYEKAAEHIYRFTDLAATYLYLVVGAKKALLIDTGSGYGDIRPYIKHITDLPVTVCITHGHVDHAGGAGWFEEAWLNKKDWAVVPEHCTQKMKVDYLEMNDPVSAAQIQPEDYAPIRDMAFHPLNDGCVFDLGGITVEMIAVPGHTQGMMCPLIREDRVNIFGDACNPATFLFDKYATTVKEYLHSLKRLKTLEDRYDHVYLSHGPGEIHPSVLDDNIQVCKDILSGNVDNQPFIFMGEEHLLAKAITPQMQRLDGKLGNIVYNPNRIR